MGKRKGKHTKSELVIAPLRQPQSVPNMIRQMQQIQNQRVLEESNNTLNLIASAYCIVLKEFYNFTNEQLKEALSRAYEQLELCADEVVTIDQMMLLCEDYGLDIQKSEKKLDQFGTLMLKKVLAFELLDKGIAEIEEIAKRGKMTSREASAFRWQWNKLKFGKDYEGDITMASIKQLVYKFFDEGVKDNKKIAQEVGSTESSVATYRRDWKKEILEMLSTEEAAPYFTGEKELWKIKIEKLAAIQANEKIYTSPTKEEKKEDETAAEAKENTVSEQTTKGVAKDIPEEKELRKKGLKKIVKVIEIQGEIALYKPCNDCFDIELEEQVLTLSRQEMLDFAEELIAVANDKEDM